MLYEAVYGRQRSKSFHKSNKQGRRVGDGIEVIISCRQKTKDEIKLIQRKEKELA